MARLGYRFEDLMPIFVTSGAGALLPQRTPGNGTDATIVPGNLKPIIAKFGQGCGANGSGHNLNLSP
jgi:hypothetical protein